MKRFYKRIVFSLLLVSNVIGVSCSTSGGTEVKEKERDVRASGARLGEKIGFVVGVACLFYLYYAWNNDTWGVRKYYGSRFVKRGVSTDFAKQENSWLWYPMPKSDSGKGLVNVMARETESEMDIDSVPSEQMYKPSDSLLSMAGDGVEKTKDGDAMRISGLQNLGIGGVVKPEGSREPFSYQFRNLDGGNYLPVGDDNGYLSGNEVFVGPSPLKVGDVASGKSGHKRKRSLRPCKKTKHNKFMTKARETAKINEGKANLLRDAKNHKARTDELNRLKKESDPDATTVRYSLVDRIIVNGK